MQSGSHQSYVPLKICLSTKNGPEKFRFTVDLRPLNQFSMRHQFLMQNIEQELHKLAGSEYYSELQSMYEDCRLPLDESSQSSQLFITPDGIFSLTRVLHESKNSVLYLQLTLSSKSMSYLIQKILLRLEDIMLPSQAFEELLDAIRQVFFLPTV